MSKPRFSVRGHNIINGDTGLIVACCEPHSGVARLFVGAVEAAPVREAEIERLRAIESAARNLSAAMLEYRDELLSGYNSNGWDWAWDQLADALDGAQPQPVTEARPTCPECGEEMGGNPFMAWCANEGCAATVFDKVEGGEGGNG